MAADETSPPMSPTEWFDQFPTAFIGSSGQWCARHWAPCPMLGANGIGATTELIQIFINGIAKPGPPEAMNAQMEAIGRICCTLGDERMYEIWSHWPPANPEASDA